MLLGHKCVICIRFDCAGLSSESEKDSEYLHPPGTAKTSIEGENY